MSTQPSELILGKQEMLTTAFTTVATDNPYNIFNSSQMSTASPCYIEKVNCTTYSQPNETSSVSPLSTYSSTSPESPSTMSTLTSLLLLSTVIYNNSLSDANRTNLTSYQSYGNETDDYNDDNILMTGRHVTEEQHQYNEFDYKSDDNTKKHGIRAVDKFSEQNVPETQHYILPIFVELFNYNAYKNETSNDDDFLTPEDYPDLNETYVPDIEDPDLNFSSTAVDFYSSTTDTFTTDDGCSYITICPDESSSLSSMASSSGSSQSSISMSTVSYVETTETKAQPPATTPPSDGEYQVPQDLSLYTKSLDIETRRKLRSLCWETMFGQELVKLTVMDLVLTIVSTLLVDFIRAIFVRTMNNCWCWDLEKKFPQYGDFKIAENILHLVNNQGMVWMGMFFSPGLPLINLIKLIVMMYLRSWTVLTCNVPHEVVFRASSSNNFYLALLLTMLFLCVLPVSYAIVWVEPSWHCGPFSNYEKIYHLFTNSTKKALPSKTIHKALDYIASPGIVIPLLMLLVLIIYYLISLTNALREANNDLKVQLRRERTEERRKVFQMVDRKHRVGGPGDLIESTPFQKWQKTLNVLPSSKSDQSPDNAKEENGQASNVIKTDAKKLLSKISKHATHKHMNEESIPIIDADGTDVEQVESLPDDRIMVHHGHKKLDEMPSVEVHKPEIDLGKKRHSEDMIQHKHPKPDKHAKHERHSKDNGKLEIHEKQDKTVKHGKRHGWFDKESKTSKELKKQERKDSSTSIQSDTIPEIRISQSTDDESQEESRFKRPSKSSSADTIITTGPVVEKLDKKLEDTDTKTTKKMTSKSKTQTEKAGYSGGAKEEQKKHHDVYEKVQTNKKQENKHEKLNDEDTTVTKPEKKSGRDKHVIDESAIKTKQKDNTKTEDKSKADRSKEHVEDIESKGNRNSKAQHHTAEIENKSKPKHHTDGAKIKGKIDTVKELEDNEEDVIIKKKKKRHSDVIERSGSITQLIKSEPPQQNELSFKLKSKHKKHVDDHQLPVAQSTESGEFLESSKKTETVKHKHADGKHEGDKAAQVHRIETEGKDTKQKEKHKISKEKCKEQSQDENDAVTKDKTLKSHIKTHNKKHIDEKPTKEHVKERKISRERHSKLDDEESTEISEDDECDTDNETKIDKMKMFKSKQPTNSTQIRSSESVKKEVDESHVHKARSKPDTLDHKTRKDSGSDNLSKSRHSDKFYETSKESHSQEETVDEKDEEDDDDDEYSVSQQSQLQSQRSKSTIEEQTSKDSSNNSNID